jgi:hypothetical protein
VDNTLYKERFAQRRELFLRCLRGVAAGEGVSFRLVDRAFTFSWAFDRGDEPHPWRSEGGLDFAEAYCQQMIDMGISVAFGAVFAADGSTTIWLRAWERPEEPPPWPEEGEQAVTCAWSPVSGQSELVKLLRR